MPQADAGLTASDSCAPKGRQFQSNTGRGTVSSYVSSLHHIVFSTKHRKPALTQEHKRDFLGYCCGIVQGIGGHVHRINCMEDHLHILVGLPSTVSLAVFVKRFKISSGNWLRAHPHFPAFDSWQSKYGAFSVSWTDRDRVIDYIKNQEVHHRNEPHAQEMRRLAVESGLRWDPKYDEEPG